MATEARPTFELRTESLTSLHWLAVVLAFITGAVHLYLAASFIPEPMGIAFLVAALGFFGAVVAFLIDFRRKLLYLLGIPFTAGQILAWYVVNAPEFSMTGIGDKVVQVLLIVVIAVLYRRES